jgi:hypothetical protein
MIKQNGWKCVAVTDSTGFDGVNEVAVEQWRKTRYHPAP